MSIKGINHRTNRKPMSNKLADRLLAGSPDEVTLMLRIADEFKWPGVLDKWECATAIHLIAKTIATVLEKENA